MSLPQTEKGICVRPLANIIFNNEKLNIFLRQGV